MELNRASEVPTLVVPLDDVDRSLVLELHRNGRASYAQLASAVGLSPAAARARVRRLLDERIVRIVGIANPALPGQRWAGVILLKIGGDTQGVLDHVIALPEATHVAVVLGEFDINLELRCSSDEHLLTAIDEVRTLKGVDDSESLAYLRIVKEAHSWQITEDPPQVDDIDSALVEALEADGRATYAQLAPSVGLSEAAVRVRVQRLIHDGVVTISTIVDPVSLGLGESCGVGIKITGSARTAAERIASLPNTDFIAVTAGRLDEFLKRINEELSFLVRTFFYVLLGLIVDLSKFNWTIAAWGLALFATVFGVRMVVTFGFGEATKSWTSHERVLIAAMVPRGVATAVMAFLPASAGIPDTENFPMYALTVITLGVLFMTLLLALYRSMVRHDQGLPNLSPQRSTTPPRPIAP